MSIELVPQAIDRRARLSCAEPWAACDDAARRGWSSGSITAIDPEDIPRC